MYFMNDAIKNLPRLITRQRILAAYFYLIGKSIKSRTLYFKHLFLLSEQYLTANKYSFIPYKFGAYSFTLENDLRVLSEKGLLNDPLSLKAYFSSLDKELIDKLLQFYEEYKSRINDKEKIIQYTYELYPYFSINSEIVSQYPLGEERAKKIRKEIEAQDTLTLFTIGYESRSVENFFNLLIKNNINCLADVRCNRLSMKFGFSGGKLSAFCKALNIKYLPYSELGIESDKRQHLDTEEDYVALFKEYSKGLENKKSEVKKLAAFALEEKRIALMCFEYQPHMCHRTVLANELMQYLDMPLIAL